MRFSVFSGLFCLALSAQAMTQVALTTRSHWPNPINTDAGFDAASRAEILAFASAFEGIDTADAKTLADMTKLKSVDADSVAKWKARLEKTLVANFAAASKSCGKEGLFCASKPPADWASLTALAKEALPKTPANLVDWREEMTAFWRLYAIEQVRLAALFPKVTSEILPLQDDEIFGLDFPDKSFALTFDDGPSPANGSTEKVVSMLRDRHVNGTFFLLGNALEARRKSMSDAAVKGLYAGMCLGSHGMEHKSHASWAGALPGLAAFHPKLREVLPEGQPSLALFRPPYGQRNDAVLKVLADSHMREMLWNIDSQDWQSTVKPDLAVGRVTSLMLLWRRGIVLFHDIHPKAQEAVPAIWKATDGAHVTWRDCHAE